MPLYEYQCLPNGHRFEVRHGMNESPVQECLECKGPVRRVIHPVGIVFKGSGFYVNDSRKSNPASKAPESKAESKTESTSAPTPSSGDSGSSSSSSSASGESKPSA